GMQHMNRKGFTLIELLIVVVIMGVMAASAVRKFANTKGKAYIASMKSDLRNLVTAEEAFFADSVKYSTNVTSKVGGVACTPVAGQVSWCPTTGNNLVTLNVPGGGWDATMTNNNLTGGSKVTCSIFVNEGADPSGIATSEGAPACKYALRQQYQHERRGVFPRRLLLIRHGLWCLAIIQRHGENLHAEPARCRAKLSKIMWRNGLL